jgi:hypothetical protein
MASGGDWQNVPQRKPTGSASLAALADDPAARERSVTEFLATFKTQPCPEQSQHDLKQCPYNHNHFPNVNDRRRNPFEEHYTPDEDGCTGVEMRTIHCCTARNCARRCRG